MALVWPAVTTERFPVVIRFRATKADRKRLDRLAQYYERAPSDCLRRLLAEAAARLPAPKLPSAE